MDNHVLITHFNLEGIKEFPDLYSGTPSWMEYRLEIFEKYTIPSLVNQTDSDFHLLMFCHTNTPSPHREKLLEFESKYKFIKLMWDQTHFTGLGGDIPSFYNSIKSAYLEVRNNNSDEIICSKIGTDDLIDTRFNEVIKNTTNTHQALNLARGLYWDINENKFIYSYFPSGPFISVKSTLTDFKGDMREFSHHDVISEAGGAVIDTDYPLWIQLIHGNNVWNTLERMPGQFIDHPGEEYIKNCFGYGK